jgi:LEA14-like dessication related protein
MSRRSTPLVRLKAALAAVVIFLSASAALAAEDKKLQVALKGVDLTRIYLSTHSADATVGVVIDNPGSGFKVKNLRYRLKLNGDYVAEGQHKEEIEVRKASVTTVEMPVTIDLLAIPGVTWRSISGGFKLRYDVETEFSVPVFAFYNHKVKTTFSGEVPLSTALRSLQDKPESE